MPTITTIGALAARSFGFDSESHGTFWWASIGIVATAAPPPSVFVGINNGQQPLFVGLDSTGSGVAYGAKFSSKGVSASQTKIIGATGTGAYFSAPVFDSSGNAYVYAEMFDGTNDGFGIIKLDSTSTTVSAKFLSDDQDGLVVAGVTLIGTDIYYVSGTRLYKLNSSLALQWGYGLSAIGTSQVGIGTDGTYVYTASTAPGPIAVVTKWDSSGAIQWSNGYFDNTTPFQTLYGIAVDSSGNSHICGVNSAGDGILVKIDTSGAVTWQASLTAAADTLTLCSVAVDNVGNVYVCGGTSAVGVLAKYNISGTLQWQRSMTISGSAIMGSSLVVGSNGIVVAAVTAVPDGALFRLPTDGTKTGTYGAFVYTSSSFTASSPGDTVSATGNTRSAHTPATITETLSSSAASATITTTSIP
jgi:hypothetical protein